VITISQSMHCQMEGVVTGRSDLQGRDTCYLLYTNSPVPRCPIVFAVV